MGCRELRFIKHQYSVSSGLCMLSLKHIILGGKGVGGKEQPEIKKRVRFPCQTTSDIREQAQGTLLSPYHSLSFLLPERYWRPKLNRPWELEQVEQGEALGTLNLVGWLCGTLSLSRQLQQLPMVSEQAFHPRDRQGMSRSPVTLPRSSEQTLHCEHVLQPRGCRTQTHPEGMLSQPRGQTCLG